MGAVARANDWPQLGYDGSRTRATAEISGAPFRALWRAPLSTHAIVATPAVADGVVVIAVSDGQLRGLRVDDGSQLWRRGAGAEVSASPAIWHGRAFVPTLGGHLVAIRIADGSVVWDRVLGGQNYGSPTLSGDSLIVAATFPVLKLMRLASATGAREWETNPGVVAGPANSSAAVDGGQVIFGTNDGRYQSLDLATGAPTWTVDTRGLVNLSAPLLAGDTAYLLPGGHSATAFAVERQGGRIRPGWPVTVRDPAAPAGGVVDVRHAVSSPALVGGQVVFQIRFEYTLSADDGPAISYSLREYVVAIDRERPAVVWQHALAARTAVDPKLLPALGLCPTPAVFATAAGPALAAASSLLPTVRVLDGQSGRLLWEAPTAAPSRSSPVIANGHLLVASENGFVQAFASDANHPPAAPTTGFVPSGASMMDGGAGASTLRWGAAKDPDGGPLSYEVRLDSDGEILETWSAALTTRPGETALALPRGLLRAGGAYVFAVRSRDAAGALSSWSAVQSFRAAPAAWIGVGGKTYDALGEAMAAAVPGATISLGRGTLRLAAPLRLPAGVSLVGQGPHDTVLDGGGLATGIEIGGDARPGGAPVSQVRGLAVTGAWIGIDVKPGSKSVLANVVVRDSARAGIEVETGGSAEARNATLVGNGAGAAAAGALSIRNSIVTGNEVGLSRRGEGTVASRYNDLYGNRTADYEGVAPGPGDISAGVTFAGDSRRDFRVTQSQATTDKGDPADSFALEPAPNGGRVNLGAFGNTPAAEPSYAAGGSNRAGGAAGDGHSFEESSALAGGCPLLLAMLGGAYALHRRRRRARLRGKDRVQWVIFR